MGVLLLLLLVARGRVEAPVYGSCVAAGSLSLVAAVGGVIEVAPDLHRERQEWHPLALDDVPVLEDVGGDAVVASGASMMDVSAHNEAQSVSVISGGATASTLTGQTSIPAPRVIDAASADAALAATQGTTQTNCRVQLKELCDRFRIALAFSDAMLCPVDGFVCDVSVGNTHVGRGVGPRKALAKENAAENALRALAREPPRDL